MSFLACSGVSFLIEGGEYGFFFMALENVVSEISRIRLSSLPHIPNSVISPRCCYETRTMNT